MKVVEYTVRETREISCEIEVDQDASIDAELITEEHEHMRYRGHFDDEHSRGLFHTEVTSIKVGDVELLQNEQAGPDLMYLRAWRGRRITVEMVRDVVEMIDRIKEDGDIAHSMQDKMFAAVLHAVATDRADNPREVCAEALKALEIDFARYCA